MLCNCARLVSGVGVYLDMLILYLVWELQSTEQNIFFFFLHSNLQFIVLTLLKGGRGGEYWR